MISHWYDRIWYEQWPKPWLFAVHRRWNTTQLCRDDVINYDIRIPIKQPVFHGKYPKVLFVVHVCFFVGRKKWEKKRLQFIHLELLGDIWFFTLQTWSSSRHQLATMFCFFSKYISVNLYIYKLYKLGKSLVVPFALSPFRFGWIFESNSLKVKPLAGDRAVLPSKYTKWGKNGITSLKIRANLPLNINAWKMNFPFGSGPVFRCELLVSASVVFQAVSLRW